MRAPLRAESRRLIRPAGGSAPTALYRAEHVAGRRRTRAVRPGPGQFAEGRSVRHSGFRLLAPAAAQIRRRRAGRASDAFASPRIVQMIVAPPAWHSAADGRTYSTSSHRARSARPGRSAGCARPRRSRLNAPAGRDHRLDARSRYTVRGRHCDLPQTASMAAAGVPAPTPARPGVTPLGSPPV